MKKVILLMAIVAMAAIAQALPTTQFATGEFGEMFGTYGEGSAGGWINAEDSFWTLTNAYSQGASFIGVSPLGGNMYLTEYKSGAGSLMTVNIGATQYQFTDFSLWVTADKSDDSFDLTLSGKSADGLYAVSCLDGFGYININPDTVSTHDWTGYDQWGSLAGNITVSAVPAPGAILLGVMGTSLVGWLRRRRSL